jgi:hypothetical protein
MESLVLATSNVVRLVAVSQPQFHLLLIDDVGTLISGIDIEAPLAHDILDLFASRKAAMQ